MTPAMLLSLLSTHRELNDPKAKKRRVAEQGGIGDLLALASMPRRG